MFKLTKEQFFQDEIAYSSTVDLLAESYLDPKRVLETAFIKSDTIYYQSENSVVQAIALSKVFAVEKYPKVYFIYLGMTAGKKNSKKGEAFNCVIEKLKDTYKEIGVGNTLYGISSISTPFTYNYYKRFSTDLQPDLNGIVEKAYEDLYLTILESTFGNQKVRENVWLLKEYSQTRYAEHELLRIQSYLEKNKVYLFEENVFDLKRGDRVIVLGKVNENLESIN